MGHIEHLKQCAKDGYTEGQQDSWQVNVSQNSLNKLLAAFEAVRAEREHLYKRPEPDMSPISFESWQQARRKLGQAADAALRELEGE